jgi:hypothetical protein
MNGHAFQDSMRPLHLEHPKTPSLLDDNLQQWFVGMKRNGEMNNVARDGARYLVLQKK